MNDNQVVNQSENQSATKPLQKKWWFWAIVAVLIFAVIGSLGEDDASSPTPAADMPAVEAPQEQTTPVNDSEEEVAEEAAEADVPTEYLNALKKAQVYSDTMHMSKKGLYKQLTSDYGEQFGKKAAQYAIDNVDADWNQNALEKAKVYSQEMAMSKSAIYDQLISEYGEQFTKKQAQYAVDNLPN